MSASPRLRPVRAWPLAVLAALVVVLASGSASAWSTTTRAPHPVQVTQAERDHYLACGAPDAALMEVAAMLAARRAEGKRPPAADLLVEQLRAAGAPYLWPRAWALKGGSDIAGTRLAKWAQQAPPGPRRCGVAHAIDASGRSVLAAVSAAAPASMKALPRQARQGEWLDLKAQLSVRASGAKVILLGPHGRPRRVLASLSGEGPGQVLRSRFTLDQPGRWLIQVVADLDGGPRPVLEALVFADAEPHGVVRGDDDKPKVRTKRGKARMDAPPETAEGLFSLLNHARGGERMAALKRDPELDALAESHASDMAEKGRTAHDVGHGSPRQRAAKAGVRALHVGENVASAPTVMRVHRALWHSPSHRENMLDRNFRRVGVAVVTTKLGRRYAVQLYAD